jgi:transcriptional regulator GlxA family with amidase domain
MTKPLVVKPSRTFDYIAVRFHPGAAHPLFGPPMREFSNQRVGLGSIWSPRVASEWSERIAEELPSRRVRLFERLLIDRLTGCPPPEPRVGAAVRMILCSGGSIPVERLSPILGLTRQHLTRLFQCHVGVGVKAFSRIIRMRLVWSALEKLPSESRIDWAGLAVDCGYFDQAHLIREFRALTGLAPGRMHRV